VIGREKHLYSIYRKMRAKRKSFSEIMDIYAFRIVVDSVDRCYRVLGCIHSLYKPVPGEFKDYIAIPKANGYQSLHTVTMGMHGVPIEIQIRTHEMEDMANNGIAAHWLYKTDSERQRLPRPGPPVGAGAAGDAAACRQQSRVYREREDRPVPGRDLRVHAEGPHHGTAARRDGGGLRLRGAHGTGQQLCRLSHQPPPGTAVGTAAKRSDRRGDHRGGARPNPSWFNYAVTAKARSNIRHFLKQQTREDAIALGRRLLDKSLRPMGLSVAELAPRRLASYLDSAGLAALDDLLAELAQGRRLPGVVAAQLAGELDKEGPLPEPASDSPLAIRGTEGFMVSYARCCRPLPGDAIAGYLSSERGVIVHRESCRNLAEHRDKPEQWIALRWDDEVSGEYIAELRIEVENRRGTIATIATRINSMGVNIEKISTTDKDYQFTTSISSCWSEAACTSRISCAVCAALIACARSPASATDSAPATPRHEERYREQSSHHRHRERTRRHRPLLAGREGRRHGLAVGTDSP
jgi:guanosine-3',5'-bis(diphosphate) 3'-pyrophosphohydrolase